MVPEISVVVVRRHFNVAEEKTLRVEPISIAKMKSLVPDALASINADI